MDSKTIGKYACKGYGQASALIILIAAIVTAIQGIRGMKPAQNPAFIGRWESTYEYPVPGGKFTFDGITEYFRNGHYNVNGTFEFSGQANDRDFSAVMLARGVGTWTADDDFLTFTLTQLRTEPGRYKSGDFEMPIPTLEQLSGIRLPDLNKHYLPGASDEMKIISQEDRKMVLQGKDPYGNPFTYAATRAEGLLKN